jgi:CheY-like chemotaxis protein
MGEPVLIVEDQRSDAEVLESLLKQIGIMNPIRKVSSALEAVSYIRGDLMFADRFQYPLPKIILLDLKMPGLDGFDFMDWLRKEQFLEKFLIYVVTGLEDVTQLRRAYAAGAKSFIQKPCTARDLINLVKAFPAGWECAVPDPLRQAASQNAKSLEME